MNQERPTEKRQSPSSAGANRRMPSERAPGTNPRPSGGRPQARPVASNPSSKNAPRGAQRPAERTREARFVSTGKKAAPPPPKRVNEESYQFSRSLSETRKRILTERKERLDDAKQFRKEDVRQKIKVGAIVFASTLAVILLVTSVIVAVVLSGAGVKKSKGEYVYSVGKSQAKAAYSDAVQKGLIYISMNSVAELCNMTMTGGPGELSFVVPGGDRITFYPDTAEAKINGYGMIMPGPAKIKNTTECAVPLKFLETVLGGVYITVDESARKVTVARLEYTDSTPQEPHYVDVSFQLKADSAMSSLDENKYFAGQPIFSFKTDVSAYDSYLNPTGERRDAYLFLANKQNPVATNYEPDNLIQVTGVKKSYWIQADVAKALEAMLAEMYAEGFTDIFVTSGYRSYNYQKTLYERYIEEEMSKNSALSYEEAERIVQTYASVPGQSEHHTGLCVDLMSTSMSDLDESFAKTKAYEWLCANAWKFGFVLRYSQEKESATGYSYEPWHWRFVGRYHALEMLRSGQCLEEYLASRNA